MILNPGRITSSQWAKPGQVSESHEGFDPQVESTSGFYPFFWCNLCVCPSIWVSKHGLIKARKYPPFAGGP